jgi:hypothetical protein
MPPFKGSLTHCLLITQGCALGYHIMPFQGNSNFDDAYYEPWRRC